MKTEDLKNCCNCANSVIDLDLPGNEFYKIGCQNRKKMDTDFGCAYCEDWEWNEVGNLKRFKRIK